MLAHSCANIALIHVPQLFDERCDGVKYVKQMSEMETESQTQASSAAAEVNELQLDSVVKTEILGDLSVSKDRAACVNRKLVDFPALESIIPSQYDYHVCECTPDPHGFRATLRLPFLTKQECQQWKTELESQTFSTFRVLKTFPKCKHKIVYKIVYRCQHSNVHKRKDSKKGTDCKAMLEFTIKKVYSQSKTKDFHLPDLPCIIKLYWIHNHDFTSTEMLKFRDVSDSTREELLSLLRQGHIAPSALKELKVRLKSKLGDDYESASLDRRFVPDIGFVKRLQKEIYGRGYKQSPTDLVNELQHHISRHNKKQASSAAMKKTDSGHIIVAIATQFMKRVSYHLKESGDVMLVKTTGDKSRYSCRVYLLLTLCSAGGLPVGCVITTSDSTSTIVQGLNLYLSLLGDKAFFSRGHPTVIMAEDSSSEADAFRLVFPLSTQLLSTYHVLKSAWKWFFGHRKSLIQKKKKPYMFSLLKRMVVSTCPEEIDHFEKIILSEYPSVTTYVAYLYAKKELWGLCYRGSYPLYSNYIYNYVDFEMAALNERILSGINNLNVIELFDLIVSKVETYYRGKISGESTLQDLSNDSSMTIPSSDVNRVEERIFVVKCQFSSLRHFVVNTDLNMCTCFAGFNGGFCKHQASVQRYFGDSFDQIAKFTCLATGKHFQDSWYHFLQLEEVAKSVEVMEAYTAETNDFGDDDDDDDDDDGKDDNKSRIEEDNGINGDGDNFGGECSDPTQNNRQKDPICDSNNGYVDMSVYVDKSANKNNVSQNKNQHRVKKEVTDSPCQSQNPNCIIAVNNQKRKTRFISNSNSKVAANVKRKRVDCVVADSTKTSKKSHRENGHGLSGRLKNQTSRSRRTMKRRNGKKVKVKKEEEETEDESSDAEMSEWNGNCNNDSRMIRDELLDNNSDFKTEDNHFDDLDDEGNDVAKLNSDLEGYNSEQTVKRILKVCNMLQKRVTEKPDIFIPPVNSFLSMLLSPRSDRQLISTLVSFGSKNS